MTDFKLRFHLFEGEGAGGEGELGAEASALLDQVTGRKSGEPEAKPADRVQYGKPEGGTEAGQVGSDQEEADLQAQFDALIGKDGPFREIYHQKVTGVIQDRLKNRADQQAQLDSITQKFDPIYQLYGVKAGDIDGLVDAITNDDGIFERGAEREGLDVRQYRELLKTRAEAEKYRRMAEAYDQQQKQNQMFQQWEEQAAELQQAVPNFDLLLEIQNNEQFKRGLDSGLDVRTAFAAAHMSEILQGNAASASAMATQNVVNNIRSRASRPVEAGIQHQPAVVRKSDPSTLTNDDLDEIVRRVEAGETISF